MNINIKKTRSLYILMSLFAFSMQSSLVWAADTSLADVPMAVKNSAAPNIIFVTDDSASMASEVIMPTNDGALWWNTTDQSFVGRNSEDTAVANVINFNKIGAADGTWKKYVYLFPNGTSIANGNRTNGDGANDHYAVPPTAAYAWVRSASYNSLYYDYRTDYTPWAPYYDGTNTVTLPNATSTAAKSHPVLGTTTLDLTSNLNINTTDWTFRMWPGMTAPSGASYRANGAGAWTVLGADAGPATGYWDVQISYYPATYYVVDPSASTTYVGPDGARLTRYEIKAGNTFPSGRTYAAEMQNFANWFTYYRKRQLMLNASMGAVLDGLDTVRGGIVRFNNRADTTMYDFSKTTPDSANERRLLKEFYNLTPDGGTPTRESLDYVGQQFKRTGTGAPIQYSCQLNIAFVLTDGFANRNAVTISPANYDGQTNYTTYPYNKQYRVNAADPAITFPYQDNFSGTISDIAMKYFTENLRPDLLPIGKVPVNPEDISPNADRNPNLHMNTYALGLGVKGEIFGTGTPAALDPFTTAPVWPDPTSADRSPRGVDDLWHAALNGRGEMYTASNPSAVKRGIDDVIFSIIGRGGSAAAVTVSNPNIVVGGVNASYQSSYNSGNWTGDLTAYAINPETGTIDLTPLWPISVQTQLDTLTAAYAVDKRKIVTYSGVGESSATGAGGIQFQPSNATGPSIATQLTAAQETVFNSAGSSDTADEVMQYLRGDRSGEGTSYRKRAHMLGDIINAEPVMVQKPNLNYVDACYSIPVVGVCASPFKVVQKDRASVLFQGANDGMVHAFNAATGAEDWAYIPKLIWPDLVNLSKKSGFEHKYYIDATPIVGDVDFKNTVGGAGLHSTPEWRTLLVGGLGKGGRGYYALDVTDPLAPTEVNAASKVLWEFPNSATSTSDADNMGYSFGRPLLVKTATEGWVVIVASGYNNNSGSGTGHGYLYVLNPRNGAVIKVIDTGVGTTGTPAGLAKISAFVDYADLDNTVQYVYGGDLLGNVWKFNFTGSKASWAATKLATLTDSSGNAQPVTTEPELATVDISNVDYQFVYVGTGQYLGDTDVGTVRTQTMYGLIDNLANNQTTITRANLQQQTMSASGATRRVVTNNSVNYASGGTRGWYLDFSLSAGERVAADPQLALGVLAFTTIIPSSNKCVPGGSSFFYALNYATGGVVANSTANYSGISLGDALASRVTLIKLPDGSVKAVIRLSDATTISQDLTEPPSPATGRRVSWREILTN